MRGDLLEAGRARYAPKLPVTLAAASVIAKRLVSSPPGHASAAARCRNCRKLEESYRPVRVTVIGKAPIDHGGSRRLPRELVGQMRESDERGIGDNREITGRASDCWPPRAAPRCRPPLTDHTKGRSPVAPPLTDHTKGRSAVAPPLTDHTKGRSAVAPPLTDHTKGRSAVAPPLTDHTKGRSPVAPPLTDHTKGRSPVAPPLTDHTKGRSAVAPPLTDHTKGRSPVAPPLTDHTKGRSAVAPPLTDNTKGRSRSRRVIRSRPWAHRPTFAGLGHADL